MTIDVKQCVRTWTRDDGRSVLLWSDLTRGLGHLLRKESQRLTRSQVLEALQGLRDEGFETLFPTTNERGRRGLVVDLVEINP